MNRAIEPSDFFSPVEMHRFLFAQAMEISQDMAAVIDLEGRITYANPAVGKVLQCRSYEVSGRFLWDVLEDVDQVAQIMEATLEYGQWQGEVAFVARGDRRVPVLLRTVLVQFKGGEILGVVGMGWDLRQQREMGEQLAHFERQRLLGEMAAGVAHNFNNILTVVLGYAEILDQDERLLPEVRDNIRMILRAAEKGAELVRRIQRGAKGTSGSAPVSIDLNTVVRDCIESTRPRWKNQATSEGRTVEIESELQATRSVDGRASEVDEVLTNLIFNAVDAMPEGGRIRVRTWDEGERVCVAVSDTGVGMDRETQRKLGELFFTTKGDKGHGLGLAVCYRIVAQMAGQIEVESVPDEGTTFTLRFPAGKKGAASMSPPGTGG